MTSSVSPALHPRDLSALERLCDLTGGHVTTSTADGLEAAMAHAQGGARVLVFASRAQWPALSALGLTVTPAPAEAGPNPLVAQRETDCVGVGAALGHIVTLRDCGLLTCVASADVLAVTRAGAPVAACVPVGRGAVIVVAGSLPEGASAGPAAGWVAACVAPDMPLSAADAADAAMLVVDDAHPPVPVVTADAPWESPLLPAAVHAGDPSLLVAAGRNARFLPPSVHDALVAFADNPDPSGAMLITGVPVGDVPATPASPLEAAKPDTVSEFWLLTVARRLGQPVGYAPEHGGDLVQNVSPTRAGADRQVSTSSKVVLEFHTEAAFHPHRPRFLMLLCLRGDPQAATTLCSVNAIIGGLTHREREVLSQPRFTTGIDESYTGVQSPARSAPRPILTGTLMRPGLWLDNDLMLGTDPEAQAALETVARLARERGTAVALRTGDLLVVDNDTAVHGRSPFTPRFDGTDRWLQRSMVVADHTAVGPDLDGRIVSTRFVGESSAR